MKKNQYYSMVLLAVTVMIATTSVKAQQVYLKPMAGATLASFVGGDYDAKMKVGLVAGAEFGCAFSEKCGITAGLLYSMQGSKYKKTDDEQKLDYLNIPVLFNYYVAPGFAVKVGPQLGILTRAKTADWENNTLRRVDDYDIKHLCNTIDFSVPVGVSYEFRDFVMDARYNIGISKVGKDKSDWPWFLDSERNSVIMFTLGYKIPL